MWSQRDPSLRKSGAGNVFVRNLDPNIDNKALYDTFSLFGNILSCKVSADTSGKSRGYGFVHFETEEAAKQAIERVNGMQIGEKTVQVTPFIKRDDKEKADTSTYTNVYIKNFPKEWDEDKLKEVFGEFGTITSSALMTDGQGRKAFFCNFEAADMAKAAVDKMHNKDTRSDEQQKADEGKEMENGPDGHPLHLMYVQRAQSKAERQREFREKFTGDSGKGQGVNLFVKNLDEKTDEAGLRELFEPFGTITSAAAMKDEKGNCKGFGFVCFATPDEATKAVTEMHLKVVKGKPLYVGLAEKREARQERLRQRYNAGPAKGGKGYKGGGGKGGGGPGPQGPGMGGMGMMQGGGPQMMGMMRPQMPGNMMMPQMMGGKGNMNMPQMMGNNPQMMMGKGMPNMMGNPMMTMMGKGGPGMGGKPNMPMNMGMGMNMMARPPMGMQRPQQMPGQAPITAAALASAPPGVQKQMLGEKLYPKIAAVQPELAGKITGMMLEMDNSELLILLESEAQLKNKVEEALRVLNPK
jgi:polyadenylate-binding protein